jgi:hypothetical protein
MQKVELIQLREALEASWDLKTSYQNVHETNNPALGQCYPTSRVVQLFFPEVEIAEGQVWTEEGTAKHFWNVLKVGKDLIHIDFTWQQFPHGSKVQSYKILDSTNLGDSQKTIARVELLKIRVLKYLSDN